MGLAPEEAAEPKRPDIVIALLPQSALSDAGVEGRCRPLLGRFPRLSVKGLDLMDTLILREDASVQGDLLALVMDDIVSLEMSRRVSLAQCIHAQVRPPQVCLRQLSKRASQSEVAPDVAQASPRRQRPPSMKFSPTSTSDLVSSLNSPLTRIALSAHTQTSLLSCYAQRMGKVPGSAC